MEGTGTMRRGRIRQKQSHLPLRYTQQTDTKYAAMSNDNDDLEGADIWGGGDAGESGSGGGGKDDDKSEATAASSSASSGGGAEESKDDEPPEQDPAEAALDAELEDETRHMSTAELRQRIHLLDNDIRIMRSDLQRIAHESRGQRERIKENQEKVKVNKQLPYLVGNVVEVLDPEAEDGESFWSRRGRRGINEVTPAMLHSFMVVLFFVLPRIL